ncbi:MAG: hypothetical protein K8T20_07570 [Planctomycetes bacterium]|nr:hypothetical protein [Planctomycetota bacterium]
MPPEQARGELDKIDERSDVYALGAILFELLTGHPPHEGPHPVTVLQSVIHGAPPQATTIEPHAPPDLAAIAHKALSREQSDRFPSARALADEVRARRDGRALTVYRYSLVEQIRGFVRRNRALAAALAFSMITLVTGTAASLYWGGKASRESEAARRAQIETDKRAAGERVALKETREALRRADGLRLAATALTLERDAPSSALALALEAADRAPGAEANNALLAALSRLQERRRLYGHDFYVLAVAWSPSGARVATAGREFQAMVWDAGTGQPLRHLAGHHGSVVQVEFSPDGTRLLTGAEDGTVRVWDVESGAAVATMGPLQPGVANGSWHPRGTQVLVWGPRTAIWPAAGGTATDLEGVASPAAHAAWNPAGTLVAVAPEEADAGVWDAATGRRRAVFAGCRALSVLWTPDGTRVVTAGPGGAALWDPVDGRRLATISPGTDLAEAAIDPAGKQLATRDVAGKVRFWNFADFTETAPPIGTVSLLAGAFSPDGSRFLRTADTTVDVIDIASGAVLSSLRGHGYTVSAARFDPTGTRIATSSCDLTACLWDASPAGAIPRVALPPEAPVIAIDAARTRVLVAPRDGDALWVDGNGRTSRAPFGVLKSGTDRLEIAPGHAVAVSSREGLGPFRLWDLETDRELGPWPAVKDADGVALAADRELVACWHAQGDTTVLDARTGREVFRRKSTRERVGDIPAADGVRLLELNPSHGEVRLTNAADETLSTLRGHTGNILQAYFLAGERTAVTFAEDSSIHKWDLGTGRRLATHTLQRMGEGRLVRSRDGKYLAVVASDFIRVIDTSDLREVFTLPGDQALAAAFSNDGTTLLAADRPGSLALVPLDVLAFARRLAPRSILPGELRRYEVGSSEERRIAAEAWDARFPSGVRTMLLANQAFNEGRLADALVLARRATETCPTYPDCWGCLLRMTLAQPAETRDLKEALRVLREYLRRGMVHAATIRKDPILDPLKSSPEFEEVLKEAPFE